MKGALPFLPAPRFASIRRVNTLYSSEECRLRVKRSLITEFEGEE